MCHGFWCRAQFKSGGDCCLCLGATTMVCGVVIRVLVVMLVVLWFISLNVDQINHTIIHLLWAVL